MGALRNIIIAVLALSIVTFIALFGQLPALRKTPIGWLQRLLCLHIPSLLKDVDRHVTGGKVTSKGQRLGHYLFYEKNPVVLILFLALLSGSAGFFLWHALPVLSVELIVPIPFLLVPPYIFTWLCVAHRSHHINVDTHPDRLHDYPYDHVLFRPSNTCPTCQLVKPARSKHCSLCGVCVAMCDHHCPWVNNCVGRGNYRWFLALLFTLGTVEIYGAYLSWWILRPHFIFDAEVSLFSRAKLHELLETLVVAVNVGGLSIAGVGMLAASTAALPFGLLAYHCYLIWAGMTTNESQKWADWRDDMADGHVFKAKRSALVARNRLHSPHDGHRREANANINPALDGGPSKDEPDVPWPVSSDQTLVRTIDGKPPTGQDGLWSQIWGLPDVDNIYDLGGWDNFMEILRGR